MAIGVDPCPFCGSPASVTEIFTGSGAYVECDNCDAAGPEAKKREDAVRLWNTRHVITPVKSESADCQLGTRLVDLPLMEQWDKIRRMIADGHEGSFPRDWFEALMSSGTTFEMDGEQYAVVPVESTHAMRQAGYEQACEHPSVVWGAMIEAATTE